jgi:hypothetical protein
MADMAGCAMPTAAKPTVIGIRENAEPKGRI